MKKILLSSAALVGVAFAAAPAMAQVDVTVGGHTKNYIGWLSQDDTPAVGDERNFDMLRESELHFNAEGTADNGLTYGFHVEAEVDGGDGFAVEESYLYLSSNLGRVNLGSEDGANYLLQVAAPSADANVDGLRQYINPENYAITTIAGTPSATVFAADGLDYDNDLSGQDEKITYLSPNWSGFQFGLSYTPEIGGNGAGIAGFATDDTEDDLGEAYEGAVRYEGTFNNIGFALGAGYTHVEIERDTTVGVDSEDMDEWNVGADFDIGAFGLGAVWTEQDGGSSATGGPAEDDETETFVVGADYTTGPFQFGVSYLNRDFDNAGGAVGDLESDRYTGGVVYTVTQGLTLRGSISFTDHDTGGAGVADTDATSVLGGVQFNF